MVYINDVCVIKLITEFVGTNLDTEMAYLEKNLDKLDWWGICANTSITPAFLEKHLDELFWYQISKNRGLPLEFFDKYADQLDWDDVKKNSAIPRKFYIKHGKEYLWPEESDFEKRHRVDRLNYINGLIGEEKLEYDENIKNKARHAIAARNADDASDSCDSDHKGTGIHKVKQGRYNCITHKIDASPDSDFINFKNLFTPKQLKSIGATKVIKVSAYSQYIDYEDCECGIPYCECSRNVFVDHTVTDFDKKLPMEVFQKYVKYIDWRNVRLPIEFIERNIKYINWKDLSRNKKIPIEIIHKYSDKLRWKYISRNVGIPADILIKYEDKLDWEMISRNKKFVEDLKKIEIHQFIIDLFS